MKFGKLFALIRNAWLIFGITIALFLFVEIVLTVAFDYMDANNRRTQLSRASADTYRDANWTKKYYKEFEESLQVKWASYVYWRRKPYRGQYINIDFHGIRKTWSADTTGAKNIHPTIFFLGGSTLWGTGARDDFTIPSIYAKLLVKRSINARVINFGETGYVSTQEVVLLMREIQKGNIPDMVIFYDGFNDIYSAFQQQRAGFPQNEFNRVKEFNFFKRITAKDAVPLVINHLADNLSIMRLTKGIFYGLNDNPNSKKAPQHIIQESPNQAIANAALASDVLDTYEKNIEIVQSLAEGYSFKVVFVWQPTIFEKDHLTEYEEKQKQKHLDIKPLIDMTNGILKQRDIVNKKEFGFHDLSMIFSDLKEPLFIDWVHLGEKGNGYIAEKLIMNTISTISDISHVEQGTVSNRYSTQP